MKKNIGRPYARYNNAWSIMICFLFFALTAQAQVSMGKSGDSRGVLDVNNENGYGNTSGVVLPVIDSIGKITTPAGDEPVPGTVVYDASRGCVRIMTSGGWSDCLLDETGFREFVTTILSVGADFKIKQASMAYNYTLCIGQDDNALYCAGDNSSARTGVGRTIGNMQTFTLFFAYPMVDVSAGESHAIAVDALGQVWVWGSNAGYRTGLPDLDVAGSDGTTGTPALVTNAAGDTLFSWRPTAVLGKAIQCEAGSTNSFVLTENGDVYAVGTSSTGSSGGGGTGGGTSLTTWTRLNIPIPERVIQISASGNSCGAVTETGKVYVWGAGATGKLGTGNATNQTAPYLLTTLPFAAGKISMGYYNGAAISADSTQLYVWGRNRDIGAGGTGTTVREPIPVNLNIDPTDKFVSVACSRYSNTTGSMTVITKQRVFVTGRNDNGQLGIGNATDQTTWQTPAMTGIVVGTGFVDAEMSGRTTMLLTGANQTRPSSSYVGYGMGNVDYRQLGAITRQMRVPTQLTK
ncbi:MAG: hypothetical protein FWF54_10405 [Candidatus Azobacteroides sp.]|nr:hypothetical protein [Candidatus Azobacteroides sp.]